MVAAVCGFPGCCRNAADGWRCRQHGQRRAVSWRWPAHRKSTLERGYGVEHARLKREWAPHVRLGLVTCAKCRKTIAKGADWHLGHNDDRTGWTGPEHARCNLRDAAIRGNLRARLRKQTTKLPLCKKCGVVTHPDSRDLCAYHLQRAGRTRSDQPGAWYG